MREIEVSTTKSEKTASKERLLTHFGGITISGRSGTGKTSTMEGLVNIYAISDDRWFKGGKTMRERLELGEKRTKQQDINLDERQKEIIRTANVDNPFIDEGRLAGFLATEEMNQNPNLSVIRLLFVAPSETRMRRILKRHREDLKEEIEAMERQLQLGYEINASAEEIESLLANLKTLKDKKFSLNKVKMDEAKRENSDIKHWRKIYPKLKNLDPFNPVLSRNEVNPDGTIVETKSKGPFFYDYSINTGKTTVLESVNIINQLLIKTGNVEVGRNFPKSGIIFEA